MLLQSGQTPMSFVSKNVIQKQKSNWFIKNIILQLKALCFTLLFILPIYLRLIVLQSFGQLWGFLFNSVYIYFNISSKISNKVLGPNKIMILIGPSAYIFYRTVQNQQMSSYIPNSLCVLDICDISTTTDMGFIAYFRIT